MSLLAPSVRTRLTLWHAGVLALVICIFAAGILLFVRARLYSALDQQVSHDLATIEKVYHEETGDLGELAHRMGITRFQVVKGARSCTRRPGGRRQARHGIALERSRTFPIESPRLGTRRRCARPSGLSASSWQ
jgi:hypothetical protein